MWVRQIGHSRSGGELSRKRNKFSRGAKAKAQAGQAERELNANLRLKKGAIAHSQGHTVHSK